MMLEENRPIYTIRLDARRAVGVVATALVGALAVFYCGYRYAAVSGEPSADRDAPYGAGARNGRSGGPVVSDENSEFVFYRELTNGPAVATRRYAAPAASVASTSPGVDKGAETAAVVESPSSAAPRPPVLATAVPAASAASETGTDPDAGYGLVAATPEPPAATSPTPVAARREASPAPRHVAAPAVKKAPTKRATTGVFIRVGAYESEENARKALTDVGAGATLARVKSRDKTIFRVQVGPFADRGQAEARLKEIKSSGPYGSAYISGKPRG